MQQSFTTTKGSFLIVKVPEGLKVISVESDLLIVNQPHRPDYDDYIQLPFKGLEIVGDPFNLEEDQCKEVADFNNETNYYAAYGNNEISFIWNTAKESVGSLLRFLKIYQTNPYGN